MNRNNYQLGSNDFILNEKADDLMNNICFLANERNYHNHFPMFSTIDFNGIDEDELIMHVEALEKIHKQVKADNGVLHHHAHLYLLDQNNKGLFVIYHNDTCYGDEPVTSAPITSGRSPLEALKNAWKQWSIPPVLVLNADYYIRNITIGRVIE